MTARGDQHGGPIFIGGTGRSGTSVMARMLGSHPAIVLPVHENKLIVEKGGLRDLVEQLGGRYDMKRNHHAVAEFVRWVRQLRTFGFRDLALNGQVKALQQSQGLALHAAMDAVARQNPASPVSLHAVGQWFGLPHYDRCAHDFIHRLCTSISHEGILVADGRLRPYFVPRSMDRDQVLEECRLYLRNLYSEPMKRAGAVRWCDDTPSNWLYVDFLNELYPDMKFIHMIRDPRDVVASYVEQVWSPSDPAIVAGILKAQFAGYETLKAKIPADRFMEIRLEDVSADVGAVMTQVSRFLGVENLFNLDFFRQDRTRTGSYADRSGGEAAALVETELADWMARHGYRASR